ncbi:MAG TPA: DUF4244 domain-containing protein [Aeromicrobium sp.]|nr:DUF4244 domain-containing protein [Aeromicrobium sp.]
MPRERVPKGPEAGVVTAEYAVGTLAAASIAVTLIHIGTEGWLTEHLWGLIREALRPGVFREQLEQMTPWWAMWGDPR